ncbi:MAG: hypothetical protein AAGA48_30265 [Myxococcota bacterium]
MASRREFTFGSMILAMTGSSTARAGIPELDVPQAAPPVREPSGPPKIDTRFRVQRQGRRLEVFTTVTNRGRGTIEFVSARGTRPGPYVGAAITIDGHRFELPAVFEGDRRQFITRAGPIPQYSQLLAGQSLEVGPSSFEWPDGVPDLPVRLTGGIDAQGHFIEFDETVRFGMKAS